MMVRRSGRYTVNWRGFKDFAFGNKPPDEEKEEQKPEEDLANHEVIFLKSIVESPDFARKCESIDSEEDLIVKPVSLGNVNIIRSLSEYRGNNIRTIEQAELAIIVSRAHFKALIEAHDQIGAIWLDRGSGIDEKPPLPELEGDKDTAEGANGGTEENGDMPVETVKVVGLRKVPGQPLGLTVTTDEHGQLIVARILAGSAAAKQALVSIGDVLLEVDGVHIDSEDQLKEAVAKPNDRITLKVGPNLKEKTAQLTNKLSCYMRALFDYNPKEDTLLPCKEIGLEFKRGDILQVSDRKDPNWWQASHVENPDTVGLIPSPELEERRKAYVAPEADFVHKISICGARISKKKKKFVYESRSSVQLEGAELALYEEVARTPPFLRRVLALVGTRGVGRRTIKNRMIQEHPDRFGAVVPHTSRPPRPMEENGQSYWFVSREEMERDAHAGRFLEYGEHNGHLYGTHLDSIRAVMKDGKMCILDCAPQSLKLLHNSGEFLPFVVMIAAPGIEQLRNLTYASNRNLTFDRQSSIRYSSRRARTLESLASLYEEEDMKQTLEDSARIQRQHEKYIDLVITNNNTDTTYSKIMDALHSLSTDHQWVPVSWIY
ncbi:protein PALS2 isoform X1 [Helicoverpa zea]|uniref:protein PALS2 isoform X1 n=1 Tax=Helicoverpa zea TaxID=7113 RepID=UPI001F58AE16|nr:protein PALS2 isoform X1 [Helicoverpa armigera]XP_047041600.1 protein PALS2 isoform X1 [Helicoverpa zea]XP_049691675.1 protein PALS2-like isoform X1 [Helicoverpa armigera]